MPPTVASGRCARHTLKRALPTAENHVSMPEKGNLLVAHANLTPRFHYGYGLVERFVAYLSQIWKRYGASPQLLKNLVFQGHRHAQCCDRTNGSIRMLR